MRPDGESGKVVWFTLPTVAPVVAAPETRPASATPVRQVFEEPLCDDKGYKPGVHRRRPEHAPARSAVAG